MKKTLKKALSIFLTVLIIVTTVPFAFAAEENEVTHQPSSGEPFVALKNSEGLTYQWYTVGYEEEEITDQNTSIADWGWTKSSYDSETGWIGADIVDHYGGNIFFVISLKANETVRVKLIGDFYDEISLFDEQTYKEKSKKYVEGVDTYDLTVKYDGNYTLYAYADCDVNEYINNRIIAHRITPVYTPVEGETSFTLNNPEFGKEYVCKISDSNGETVLITNKFEYCYAITNQPTIDNLSVGVNYTEGTTYQWYKVNGEIKEITDDNAEGDWSEFDVPFAATVYENGKWFADEFEGMQYYFRIDLKAGEKINLELSEPVESVTFSCEYGSTESVVPENSKKVTYTAKEDGCYWVITEEVIDYITAYIGDPEYIVLEAQNDATLTPSVDGMYICKVVFADGTTEMSDIVDAVVSHICDFSGEWEITDEKHWKKCANENCYIISDEDKHVYTDGKCFCGYECPHESYYNAICQKCGIECLHEIFSEVTNKGSDIFYIASTGGGSYDQQGDKLLDWDADTKWWCMFSEETQVSVTFGYPRKATIKSYILTAADDADRYPNFNWTAWTIYGTNDLQGEWTIVHSVSDAILPTEGESGAFEVNSESPYMYYKLVVDAVGDEGYMQHMADINIEVEYKNGRECDECGYICLHEGTLVSVPEKAATCTEAGWEAYKYCTACDYTTYKEIPVSDHDWSNKDGICANGCGKECNHSFTNYVETRASTCKIAGKEVATCDNGCGVTDERELPLLDHEPGEQMCKGYWCSRCRSFYGEGNPDIHLDGYSSTGKIKDGQCDGCNKQLAFIKSGETYEINSYAYVVEFAPVVDGRYILTVDGPEGTEIDVREVVDGVNKGINCEVISDLVYVVDCTVGKIYRFEASNYYGYNISSMTLECETHKGTVQTCYGYICDACGEYFGEVPGHDIVIDEAKAPTCTETGLTEGSHCSRCDDMTVAQEEIPALNHKDTLVKVDAKASTCTEAGHEAYEYCTACDYTTYKEIPASHDIIIDEAVAPKCGKTGLTAGQHCSRCDAMTIIQEIVPALTHKDSDGDYQCDYGCGHEFEKPVEPDQPDTPDEPTDDTCDHLCHKDGILGFLWKIISFFYRLLNIQQYCDCGVIHYDAPIFG